MAASPRIPKPMSKRQIPSNSASARPPVPVFPAEARRVSSYMPPLRCAHIVYKYDGARQKTTDGYAYFDITAHIYVSLASLRGLPDDGHNLPYLCEAWVDAHARAIAKRVTDRLHAGFYFVNLQNTTQYMHSAGIEPDGSGRGAGGDFWVGTVESTPTQ